MMTNKAKEENAELEQLRGFVAQLNSQVEELTLNLEIANERWVKQVNENAALEVQLRKIKKAQTAAVEAPKESE